MCTTTSALKRKDVNANPGDNGGIAPNKKLKSVASRKMSVESATVAMDLCRSKIELQETIIKDKQKDIRKWKKQIKDAENMVARAKDEESKLGKWLQEVKELSVPDSVRILRKFEASAKSYSTTETEAFNAMQDMCVLADQDESQADGIIQLAKKCVASKSCHSEGAMRALLEFEQHEHSAVHLEQDLEALRLMSTAALEEPLKTSHTAWPFIAKAIALAGGASEDWELVVKGVLEKGEQMKQQDPCKWSRYKSSDDTCPILDLMIPTWEAMDDNQNPSKIVLGQRIQAALQEAITESIPSHSMPEEAAIAGSRGFPEMQRFLLSSTESSISLNLTKSGRMAVHRLIDGNMTYGKLSHSSEGYGHGRVLVVRKATDGVVQAKKERQEKHRQLLASFGKP